MPMDAVSQRIVDVVRDANDSNTEICYKDFLHMKIAAPPTIQKKIRELLDTGELIGQEVQTPHGMKRLLFVPEKFTSAEGTVIIRQKWMMIYQLKRIADSLEQANSSRPIPSAPKKETTDGRLQTKLWGKGDHDGD